MCFLPQFRDDVYHNILTSDLPNLLEHGNITALTHLWSSGQISNFEYLTHLNKHAGRSFNDLMQYPVFPFILRDYTSETLDLQDSNIYRSGPRFSFSLQIRGSLTLARTLVVFLHQTRHAVQSDFAFTLWSCRNLSKPIAVQSKEKEDRYVDNYRVNSVSLVSFLDV